MVCTCSNCFGKRYSEISSGFNLDVPQKIALRTVSKNYRSFPRTAKRRYRMTSSRRVVLRAVGIGAAAGAAVHWPLGEIPAAYAFESTRATQPDGFVRLDSNENAYGPSGKVAEAIRS